jgi:hypothetical protein
MPTDIRLNQGDNADHLVIDANVIEGRAADFELNSPERYKGGDPHRRALVHDQRDGLTINYNGDYPGGVSVMGTLNLETINLRPHDQPYSDPKLPAHGRMGDLLVLHNTNKIGGKIVFESLTLWLCVGSDGAGAMARGGTYWKQVQLGDSVEGTL